MYIRSFGDSEAHDKIKANLKYFIPHLIKKKTLRFIYCHSHSQEDHYCPYLYSVLPLLDINISFVKFDILTDVHN